MPAPDPATSDTTQSLTRNETTTQKLVGQKKTQTHTAAHGTLPCLLHLRNSPYTIAICTRRTMRAVAARRSAAARSRMIRTTACATAIAAVKYNGWKPYDLKR